MRVVIRIPAQSGGFPAHPEQTNFPALAAGEIGEELLVRRNAEHTSRWTPGMGA
jgi:hypothetical protein